jgi:hypothetical protein
MSMPGPWDLPRRVQLALVAYCRQFADGDTMVVHARSVNKIGYPCIICEATGHEPTSDTVGFTGRRRVTGAAVILMTEAINRKFDPDKFESAAEMHAALEANIVGAFAGNTVHEDINGFQPEGVAFSRCMMGSVECEGADGKLITTIELEIEAQPKEI